jgi:hypothetical protein
MVNIKTYLDFLFVFNNSIGKSCLSRLLLYTVKIKSHFYFDKKLFYGSKS